MQNWEDLATDWRMKSSVLSGFLIICRFGRTAKIQCRNLWIKKNKSLANEKRWMSCIPLTYTQNPMYSHRHPRDQMKTSIQNTKMTSTWTWITTNKYEYPSCKQLMTFWSLSFRTKLLSGTKTALRFTNEKLCGFCDNFDDTTLWFCPLSAMPVNR